MKTIPSEDWQALKEDAYNVIDRIDVLHMDDKDYLMFGASLAILDHRADTPMPDYPQSQQSDTAPPSGIVDEVSPFDEQWVESDRFFEDYKKYKGMELKHGSLEHGVLAKDALKRMLENDEQLMVLIYRGANADERALIKESYERTLSKFK